MNEITFDPQELLAEMGWVRALARRLAADAHQADDLTQEALAVALRRRPGEQEAGSLRAWLGGVVRNLRRADARRERGRALREHQVSRADPHPPTAELVERAEAQRGLAGEVLELPEPYRTTLLLSFFEELSNEEIAARMGVPASTVASRLARGLARLRTRLESQRGGDVRPWLCALFPASEPARGAGWSFLKSAGALIAMGVQAKLLVSAGVLVGAVLVVRSLDERSGVPGEGTPAMPVAAREEAQPEPQAPRGPSARDRVVSAMSTAPEDPALCPRPATVLDPAGAPIRVRGRVVDLEGQGVAGVELAVGRVGQLATHHGMESSHSTPLAGERSGAGGAFEFDLPEGASSVWSVDERYATLLAASLRSAHPARDRTHSPEGFVVVVGWRIPLSGVVVDADGQPIEGATVHVAKPDLDHLGLVLDHGLASNRTQTTDAEGRFELEDVAQDPEATWTVNATGFERWMRPLPEAGDVAARVVLQRETLEASSIVGRVLLPDGSPAEGAHVSYGAMAERADGDGRFALRAMDRAAPNIEFTDQPLTLWAVLPGFAPASMELPSMNEGRRLGWPRDIVLQLAPADEFVIAGRVVDQEGEPIEGVSVGLKDSTRLGLVSPDGSGTVYYDASVEGVLAGKNAELRSAADGSFRFTGLVDRPYRLVAIQDGSMLTASTGPIEVGRRDVRIVLDRTRIGTLAGRLVDRTGKALAGVQVTASRLATQSWRFGTVAVTDEGGRFRIDGTSLDGTTLSLSGDTIVPDLQRALPEGADPGNLELVVARRCHVQFEWSEFGHGAELSILDADGQPMDLYNIRGDGWGHQPTAILYGELSDVYVLPDHAAWAIVRQGDEELERVQLFLQPGELQRVRL